jgi:hypothetical protein
MVPLVLPICIILVGDIYLSYKSQEQYSFGRALKILLKRYFGIASFNLLVLFTVTAFVYVLLQFIPAADPQSSTYVVGPEDIFNLRIVLISICYTSALPVYFILNLFVWIKFFRTELNLLNSFKHGFYLIKSKFLEIIFLVILITIAPIFFSFVIPRLGIPTLVLMLIPLLNLILSPFFILFSFSLSLLFYIQLERSKLE